MVTGAIIGDIAGSRFEFNNRKSKDFTIFSRDSYITDDTIMTLAVAQALMDSEGEDETTLYNNTIRCMRGLGQPYPQCGFGGRFYHWMYTNNPKPYGSYGNGAAMRISACAYFATSLEDAIAKSHTVTRTTHNHPEGIKGAEATTVLTYMALHGSSLLEMRHKAEEYYSLDFTLDEIRPTYRFNETCQNTVPQAIEAFLESTDFEDAIRNAVSLGGDSDTLAAIAGAMAEAYYGVPKEMKRKARAYLDDNLKAIYDEVEKGVPTLA